jgi:hypothetical protein
MAGINTLQEAYRKRGLDWTRNFLSSELRITEKAEAYRFSCELSRGGKLRYFGKNADVPLNRIDRTVSDLYENAIEKIERLPDSIVGSLPRSHRFGFSWNPESGLFLTDITIRQHGKLVKQIHEKDLLKKWAILLRVNCAEEVYAGTLDESRIELLLESLENNAEISFDNLDPQKTYIIRGELGITKISPGKETEVREQKSHAFDLLLLQIYEHLEEIDFGHFAFQSERTDERYIEVVCEAFNRFVRARGQEFLEMGIQKPAFLEKSGKFNRRWVRNSKTLEILESNKKYEYLLSIFLTNLRKQKKASGLLRESFVESYNQKVQQIEETIQKNVEPGLPEFQTVILRESLSDSSEEFSEDDQLRAISMMQTYFAAPFINTNEEETEVVHECNLLLMNTGQITNQVLQECERLMKLTGKGFALIHDSRAGNNCPWGFGKEEGDRVAAELVESHPHIFECSESVAFPSLENLLKVGGERKIKRVYTGRSCGSLLKEKETANQLANFATDVQVSELGKKSFKEIEDCLEKEDHRAFQQVVPECLQRRWNNMLENWKKQVYR